jgi:nucleoside-diphosphate-sugar epimerase
MTKIAITGPTGIFGQALVEHLDSDRRVAQMVGIARRPFEPAEGSKLTYRRGDVRELAGLAEAFAGADAVAHLAFAKFGHGSHADLHAINVDGTMNAFGAAAVAGVKRFVFASSAAAYGCYPDNAARLTEDHPARGSQRWFYSREKAELERRLRAAATEPGAPALIILRPTIVVGPRTAASVGDLLPPAVRPAARVARRALARLPFRTPVLAFPQPMQFVHETDVAEAFALALLGGPAGTFNLAGDGVLDGAQVMRELGLAPLPLPDAATRSIAGAVMRLPHRSAALEAAEVATQPILIDATRAKRELGWRPVYSSIEALRTVTS